MIVLPVVIVGIDVRRIDPLFLDVVGIRRELPELPVDAKGQLTDGIQLGLRDGGQLPGASRRIRQGVAMAIGQTCAFQILHHRLAQRRAGPRRLAEIVAGAVLVTDAQSVCADSHPRLSGPSAGGPEQTACRMQMLLPEQAVLAPAFGFVMQIIAALQVNRNFLEPYRIGLVDELGPDVLAGHVYTRGFRRLVGNAVFLSEPGRIELPFTT